MWFIICFWVFCCFFHQNNAQYYPWLQNHQNFTATPPPAPYPYQTALSLNPYYQQNILPQYPIYYGPPPNFNPYLSQMAQFGRPAYPGFYPQPYYPQPYEHAQRPNFAAQLQGFGLPQQIKPTDQRQGTNVETEILDVSPEYQRQILGWPEPEKATNTGSKPRYTVDVDSQTSNITSIPTNLTKPIVSEKKFLTSIKRTFVYDSSKPENVKPINIHIVNGQQVTTSPPPTTTENENVEEHLTTSSVKPSGRRYMDVPKTCPKGSLLAHNGQCIEPFTMREPPTNSTNAK